MCGVGPDSVTEAAAQHSSPVHFKTPACERPWSRHTSQSSKLTAAHLPKSMSSSVKGSCPDRCSSCAACGVCAGIQSRQKNIKGLGRSHVGVAECSFS